MCRTYAITARGMRCLAKGKCAGDISSLIHGTHTTRVTAGTTWCTKCGAYTTRWPRRLGAECSGRPQSEAQRNILRRLSANLPPTTAGYLGDVAADNGGLRDGKADHKAELLWRQLAAGSGNDQARTKSDTVRAATGGGQLAAPPTGRYARLRGGALHADTVHAMTDDKDRTIAGVTSLRHERRSDHGTAVSEVMRVEKANICQPSADDSWTRRVTTSTVACASICGSCRTPTRTECRGCGKALCITCARQRRPCSSTFTIGDAT